MSNDVAYNRYFINFFFLHLYLLFIILLYAGCLQHP